MTDITDTTDITDQKDQTDSAVPADPADSTDDSVDEVDSATPATPADPADTTDPVVPDTQEVTRNNPDHVIISEKENDKARWFILHTYSGHEAKVADTLKQRIHNMQLDSQVLEVLIPTQEKIQIRRGKKQAIKEKIFPGYIMIKMELTDESWLAVRTCQGVTGFVGVGNKPTSLPPQEVESIQRYMAQGAPTFKTSISIGEAVKIVEGPFADFLGTVDTIDEEKGKLTVLVSIFDRETPVELDILQVAKI